MKTGYEVEQSSVARPGHTARWWKLGWDYVFETRREAEEFARDKNLENAGYCRFRVVKILVKDNHRFVSN